MNLDSIPRNKLKFVAAGPLLPLALAGAGLAGLLSGAALRSAAPAARPHPEIVRVCVSVRLTGGPRLATWWAPAFSERTSLMRRAFLRSSMACGLAPWRAGLPDAGALHFSN
jgi:hypothetical protein